MKSWIFWTVPAWWLVAFLEIICRNKFQICSFLMKFTFVVNSIYWKLYTHLESHGSTKYFTIYRTDWKRLRTLKPSDTVPRFAVINYQKNNFKYFTYSTVTCRTQVPEILVSVYLSLPDYRLLHAMICSYQNRHIKTNINDEDNCLFNC